jgi:hypothetical protein
MGEFAQPTPIDGGFCVKVLPGGEYCVDVRRMAFNWRLLLAPRPPLVPDPHMVFDHGWCYFGHGHDAAGQPRTMQAAYLRALAAAHSWDGVGAPEGFDKAAF